MKETRLIIASIFIAAILVSCNGNGDKTETKNPADSTTTKSSVQKLIILADDCPTIDNFLIPQKEGEKMQHDYDSIYVKAPTDGRHLSKSVWIDRIVIQAFLNLFDRFPGKYDGIRFLNAVNREQDPTTLIMIPTVSINDKGSKNMGEDRLLSDHDNDFPAIPFSGANPKYEHFGFTKTKTGNWHSTFELLYQTPQFNGDNCLSKSVWFSKCVFDSLRKYLDDESGYDITGINVLFGAYNMLTGNPSQLVKNQSTVILVPTTTEKPEGDWDMIVDKSHKKREFNVDKTKGGLNHGELCPKNCPPEGR